MNGNINWSPTYLNLNYKNVLYCEFLGALKAWETISHFQFEFNPKSTKTDIVTTFTPPKHKLFEGESSYVNSLAQFLSPSNSLCLGGVKL
jgi:hypothetical protein